MDNVNIPKVLEAHSVFDNRYIETRALYLYHFNALPNIHFISSLDCEKAFEAFRKRFSAGIRHLYTYRWYTHEKKKFNFDKTIIILDNDCLVELYSDYCEILHNGKQENFIAEATALLTGYKARPKRQPSEINLIIRDAGSLEFKTMAVKSAKLDLDLFYADDFKEIDNIVRTRLKNKNDKGIVLLHGLPGTGKTTYLRYLISTIKKKVLLLSPNVAANLTDPGFIDLLIENPNSVLVIEDAENIVMDRRINSDSSVSNLLNISDGLLADFLNVQLICTFNSPLTMVDSALMRKGRLIAKYEFGKLSVAKAQRLSYHLGFKNIIKRPMTVAEIANQHESDFAIRQVEVVGFRRDAIVEN